MDQNKKTVWIVTAQNVVKKKVQSFLIQQEQERQKNPQK